MVYLKGSGPIEDLLTYLGAPAAAMELMQVKMYKEVKNDINRKTNFETANMDKTYSASAAGGGHRRHQRHPGAAEPA